MPYCKYCRAWVPMEKAIRGECRRRAPVAVVESVQDSLLMRKKGTGMGAWPYWPATLADEWCLEGVEKV